MKLRILAFAVSSTLAIVGCDSSGDKNGLPDNSGPVLDSQVDPTANPDEIAFNNLAVHDPSVIRVDDTFYVFGSHLAAARSDDLMSWSYISNPTTVAGDLVNANGETVTVDSGTLGVNWADNPLFPDYAGELADAVAWTGGFVGSWASDVIQLEDGRFYFYYNHCANQIDGACNSSRSYLGLAVSDSIDGPYEQVETFLHSGHTPEEMALDEYNVGGLTAYDGNVHPNAIDPDVFYDKNGELWMVYGSYSGGIYILAMDETTGLPEAGQGYGKHIMGGFFSAIEGPYMLYSPESDYYYLFTSFGGFAANDGYNMRIARSRTPDGDFEDTNGSVAPAAGGWDAIEPYGVKLMGGFEFESHAGDPNDGWGYMAPGHNSAYYDEQTGQYFLITHTRFPGGGEGHSIRVHEMFINNDGWLVASPLRYAPIEGDNVVDEQDTVGTYKIINHERDINREPKPTEYATLDQFRQVTGEYTGTYETFDDSDRIRLVLDRGTYEGVIKWQWDNTRQELVPAFTALNASGEALWGVQMPEQTPEETLDDITASLTYPASTTQDYIELPTRGTRGAEITWETSNIDVVKPDGTVLRPAAGEADANVTLTANIELDGGWSTTKTVDLTVLARKQFNRTAQYDFETDLTDTLGNFATAQSTGDRIWKLNEGAVGYAAGHDGDAVQLDGMSNGVRLPDGLISSYEYTVSMWINPTAVTDFSTLFFGAINQSEVLDENDVPSGNYESSHWLSLLPAGWSESTAMLWSNNDGTWFDGLTGTTIPANEWTHLAFSVRQGVANVMINGTSLFQGGTVADFFSSDTGLFSLGVNYWDVPFNGLIDELKIYEAALTPNEITELDINYTPADQLLQSAIDSLEIGDVSAVKDNIYLPVTGPYASAVEWVSSDPSVIEVVADEGLVTRPPRGSSDATVTLTATVTLDGQQDVKEFVATVSSLTPPEPVAVYSFEGDLSASGTGGFGAGTVTGNRISNTGGTIDFAEGVVGQALTLDGTSGVKLPNNLVTGSTYSTAMWLSPNEGGNGQYTTAFFGGSTARWISVVPGGIGAFPGQVGFWYGADGFWGDAPTGVEMQEGSWYHLVSVYQGGNLTLYLNGEEVFSGAGFADHYSALATSEWAIGVNHWDVPYNGMMDELRIYDETLSPSDVAELYQAGTTAQ